MAVWDEKKEESGAFDRLADVLAKNMDSQARVFDKIGEQAMDARLKTAGTCPTLKGNSPDELRVELKRFYTYVNDARISDRAKYFKLARGHCSGPV